MQGRPSRESLTEYAEFALPNDANHLDHLLGGKVMHLVDITGAMAAMRLSRRPVVTVSVDYMTFLHPVHIGQLVFLRASVNRVFRTSLEVGVKVFREDLVQGGVTHTSSANLTYVALDDSGAPCVEQAAKSVLRLIGRARQESYPTVPGGASRAGAPTPQSGHRACTPSGARKRRLRGCA